MNDIITFSVERIQINTQTLNIVQIEVNDEKWWERRILSGLDVYPEIKIESPEMEIETFFEFGEACYDTGNR